MGGRNRGGQKRGRTQRRHFRDGRENVWKKPREEGSATSNWDPFVTENPVFEQYYKKQGIVPENEWDDFLETLRKPLPAVFRINASGQFSREIGIQIQHEFMEDLRKDNEMDGEVVEQLKPLPWYPGKFAWHLNFSRMQLRKNQTLARMHEFLKRENEIGSITRQEAVSMLPPLFLDVHPHHRVLDMCAAPGSKTFQLLEMIHSADKRGSLPDGLVVANDLDVQRCHLLIHQTKRMCSPNVIVTNHEAQHFPGLKKERDCTSVLTKSLEKGLVSVSDSASVETTWEEEKGLTFDRVLCDVPCSGDGTIRKAPDLWKKWNAGIANGLHRLQVQIAMRGVALLRVGGRLVYSTCSLNPVEDEAVVGEILRRSKGCMELIDVCNELPQLKRRPGLKTWKIRDKGLWISSYQHVSKQRAGVIIPSMFPTGKGNADELEQEETYISMDGSEHESVTDEGNDGDGEVTLLPLERCMRILPHDQDTGGFFVAVFQKISAFQVEVSTRETLTKHSNGVEVDATQAVAFADTSFMKEKASEALQNDNLETVCDLISDEVTCEKKLEGRSELKGVTNVAEVLCSSREDLEFSPSETKQVIGEAQVQVSNPGDVNKESSLKSGSRIQLQGHWKGLDPVLFLTDEDIINSLVDFYGIRDTLPLHGHLVTRSEDTSRLKRIYYISNAVANVLRLNFRAGEQMKITSVGLKIFERQGGKEGFSPCAFRIASEGLPVLLPHVTKQIVHASKEDFKLLLSSKTVPFTAFLNERFTMAVQAILPGCCIVILDDGNHSEGQKDASLVPAIGCWRGRTNMSLLIPKVDAIQLLERLKLVEGDELHKIKADGEALREQKSMKTVEEDDLTMVANDLEGGTLVVNEVCGQDMSTKLVQDTKEEEHLLDKEL